MPDYLDYDFDTLLTLLVDKTSAYSAMMMAGTFSVEEIAHCKQTLREIQGAIFVKQGDSPEYIDLPLPNLND